MGVMTKYITTDGKHHLVSTSLYGTCATASGTAAKIVLLSDSNIDSVPLVTGMTLKVKFTNANGVASPTLTIQNSAGSSTLVAAKNIYRYGTTAPSTSATTSWQANQVVTFTYDGTSWMLNDWTANDTNSDTLPAVYVGTAAATVAKVGSSTNFALHDHCYVYVSFRYTNSATSPTLNINSTGAKPIYVNGAVAGTVHLPDNQLTAGSYLGYYDGTNYYFRTDGALTVGENNLVGYDCVLGTDDIVDPQHCVALGYSTTALGWCSFAEGDSTFTSTAQYEGFTDSGACHSEGKDTASSGAASHAEGFSTSSSGVGSHAEGYQTCALGGGPSGTENLKFTGSHAEGSKTYAYGYASHAEGVNTTAVVSGSGAQRYGNHSEGYATYSGGRSTHSEGYQTSVRGDASHAEGYLTTAGADASHSEGRETWASGQFGAHAEGYQTKSGGLSGSHSEGYKTCAFGDGSHTEGYATLTPSSSTINGGTYAHAEGSYNTAANTNAHAEGGRSSNEGNLASGEASHAEGIATTASGNASHAEGGWNLSSGSCSHTDGCNNTASGDNSHAECRFSIVTGDFSHAEGWYTSCIGKASHSEGYQTCAYGPNESDADAAHAEGYQSSASGRGAHSEGYMTRATGTDSHAEGHSARATGSYSHAEGDRTTASGESSHAEGRQCKATTSYAHGEGYQSVASGTYSHAEGYCTTAGASSAHSEGYGTSAADKYSHAEGYKTYALEEGAHASGAYTSANNLGSSVTGHFNKPMTTGGSISNTTGTAHLIGNGTSTSSGVTQSNAFSVQYSGVVKAASTITASTTADYAEMFEWYDENPNDEDRVGYFITFEDGNKIRIVNNENDYILGISSGDPFVLGNGDCDYWTKLELRDDFNRVIYEPAQKMIIDEETGEFIPVYDEEGNPVYEGTRPKYNPDYDPTRPYISRLDRKEWQAVGMLGVLRVRQDGTLVKNGYCTIDYSTGKATFIDHYNKNDYIYRVIQIINEEVAEIVFK